MRLSKRSAAGRRGGDRTRRYSRRVRDRAHGLAPSLASTPKPSAPSNVGLGWLSSRVRTEATTDRPARRPPSWIASGDSFIRTATRCTTLVKLPVALSGGSSENCAPEAGEIDLTDALDDPPAIGVHRDVDLLTGMDLAELRFLEIGVDIDAVHRHQREQPHARLRVLPEFDRAVADDAVERRADLGEREVALGLLLGIDQFGAGALRLELLRLQHVEIRLGAGERGFAPKPARRRRR